MIADVIGNYLDNIEEREFDGPFMALLRAMGFRDIHFLHGTFEFGKDFIAKRTEAGITLQFAFQTKAGDLALSAWNECRGQIDLLRTNSLAHPAFDPKMARRAIFVTTGRLVGGAPLAAQQYSQHLAELGEITFTTWDRETLVELMSSTPEAGLAGASSGALLSLIGKVDEPAVQDLELEQFSRRWFAVNNDDCLARGVLEAAIIANRLRRHNRLDLAAYVALCLVRAAWVHGHGSDPPYGESVLASDTGRNLFRQYATAVLARCTHVFDPAEFIFDHNEPSAIVTYPVRCMRLIEILGLLGLLEKDQESSRCEQIAGLLADFCNANRGSAHPISDHWAVSLVAPVLLLWKTGHRATVRQLLTDVIRWIGDRYESDNLGLAGVYATPDEEVGYLLGGPFEHVDLTRRPESYVSTVLLDLAALLEMGDIYELARNDFLAVRALPAVFETADSAGQYVVAADDLRLEPNMPYKDKWDPEDQWKVAPHHIRGPDPLYLERIGRAWDQIAIASVLRDRHFVKSLRRIAGTAI
jgi:Restriction endonuclease